MSSKDKKNEKHITELEQQIEKLNAEKQELLEKLQRLSADYANYQKRVPRQVADNVAYEKRSIVRSLLPSLDNFEHAMAGFASSQADPNTVKGLQMIFDHLLEALKTLGVEKVVSVGQPFDPARHEAMMQRTEPDKENNLILEEYLPCYLLGGEPLRPAKVIVNKLPEEVTTPPAETPA
jgi:molecular chaperone GrpE